MDDTNYISDISRKQGSLFQLMNRYDIHEADKPYVDIRKLCIAFEQYEDDDDYFSMQEMYNLSNLENFVDIFKCLRLDILTEGKWKRSNRYHEDVLRLINEFSRL